MTFRRSLLLATACTAAGLIPAGAGPWAQTTDGTDDATAQPPANSTTQSPARARRTGRADWDKGVQVAQAADTTQVAQAAPTGGGALSTPSGSTASGSDQPIADIEVRRQQLLLKQKDVPSGVTEVTPQDIQAASTVQGSIATVLQQTTPNVHVYQQGPGQNYPVISVRGVRGQEISSTLDGVPTQDLIFGGQGAFLQNNIGYYYNLNQIEGVTVLPGVAAPGTQGYGSIGGTLAYQSKKPTDEQSLEVFGSYGSFKTDEYGFTLNSGKLADAGDLKLMLQYDQTETGGYVDYTSAKYRDMMFAFDKPYGDGLSHLSGLVIYNNDFGFLQSQPTPTDYLKINGPYWNFSPTTTFSRQSNDFLTTIISNETYLADDTIKLSGSAFYLNSDSELLNYQNPTTFGPQPNGIYYLFTQVPFNFYGPLGPTGIYYKPGYFNYNPAIFGNPALGYGSNAQIGIDHNDTYGITPRITVFLPNQTLIAGLLIAKETQNNQSFVYGTPNIPQIIGYNEFTKAGQQRDLYQAYFQDKVDLLHNTLHVEPGFTVEAAEGQNHDPFNLATSSPYPGGEYTLKNWDRTILPYVGASYDLTDLAPYWDEAKNIKIYASYGKSALFAPVSNFTLGVAGSTTNAPGYAFQNAYEGGIRYDSDDLLLNFDYFYQKTNRAFGFFSNFLTGFSQYGNTGGEEFKGVEGSVRYKPTSEVTLFGTAGYLNAKYLQNYSAFTTIGEDQFGYAFRDTPISGVPDVTATYGVDFDRHDAFMEGDEVFFRFFGYYTGRIYSTVDINPNIPGIPGYLAAATVTNTDFKTAPFSLFNVQLDYTIPVNYSYLKQIKFELNAQNILNTHYSNYFYNQYSFNGLVNPATGALNGYSGRPFSNALVGPPAAITLTVRAKF